MAESQTRLLSALLPISLRARNADRCGAAARAAVVT